jgi:pyruvate,water dikinase
MKKLVAPFKELTKKSVTIAGGKGASLGEMTNAKLPVPPGFVVLAQTFDSFLNDTPPPGGPGQGDLDVFIEAELNKVNYQDVNSIEKASKTIGDIITDSKVPENIEKEILAEFKKLKTKWVAVRSSATAEDSKIASWAGELDTFLYIDEKNLIEHVKKCWSSLFTPRAIFYRFEKNLRKAKVSVAVVVQQMVDSEVSGVAFSVHPVTRDKNQMIIEAGYGLGEAIVSGAITPDAYVVHKKEGTILDINIAEQKKKIVMKAKGGSDFKPVAKAEQNKQKLTGKQIMELAEIVKKIEAHYKCPQDVEWAIVKNKFYILQSRPITTL